MARKSGKELEEAFGSYMREHLGALTTEFRQPQKGEIAVRPWDCDIHGIIVSRIAIALWVVAGAGYALALAAIVYPEDFDAVTSTGRAVEQQLGPAFYGYGLFILAILASVVAHKAWKATKRNIWVECKDRKATIKRTDIIKLADACADVRAFEKAKWKPDEMWFASTSQYDTDAINFARTKGVRCFLKDPSGAFQEL